jgi:hypothetical protein
MKDYFLKPSGTQRTQYLEYLLKRLTEFRRAGASFGQKHQGEISVHVTRKIITSQLTWPLDDESHFAETCAHIQAKIDQTALGKRNAAQGRRSYHSFEEHGKPKAETHPTVTATAAPVRANAKPIRVSVKARLVTAAAKFSSAQPIAAPTSLLCEPIAALLQTFSAEPNAEEIASLWHATFETIELAVSNGRKEKPTKRTLIKFLAVRTSQLLARNASALRWNFNRKFDHWRLHGRTAASLVDGRIEANGKRRVQLADSDCSKIIATALKKHGGEVAPAFRDLLQRGELEADICQRYLLNPSRNSHVPEAIAREVSAEIKTLWPHFLGPRQAKLNGAYIER